MTDRSSPSKKPLNISVSSPATAPIFMETGDKKKNELLPANLSIVDSILGNGTGRAAQVFYDSPKKGPLSPQQQHVLPQGLLSSRSVLVDFASLAEAPAYFDLPIPLYVQRKAAYTSHIQQQQQQQHLLGSSASLSASQQQPFGDDALAVSDAVLFQRHQQVQQQEQDRKQLTSKYLKPMTSAEFQLQEQLRNLDTSPGGQIDREATNMMMAQMHGEDHPDVRRAGAGGVGRRRGGGGGVTGATGRGGATSNRNSSSNKGVTSGRRGAQKRDGGVGGGGGASGGVGGGVGGYSSQHAPPAQRMILPKAIADMVTSLRPTHYAPLRKALRTRSQERQYEGDDQLEAADSEALRRQRLDEDRRRLEQIECSVAQWEGGTNSRQQLQVPPGGRGGGAGTSHSMRDDGRVSSAQQQQQQHGAFSATFTGDGVAPRMPSVTPSSAGGSRLHSNSPLATVHAGRRPSMNMAPMVGDLGVPSRGPLPTHGRVLLHEAERSAEYERGDELVLHPATTMTRGGGGPMTTAVDSTSGMMLAEPSRLTESMNLLAGATPSRAAGTRSRMSIAVASVEQSQNSKKTEEFHRDMLAWYRTEATMLRVAQ